MDSDKTFVFTKCPARVSVVCVGRVPSDFSESIAGLTVHWLLEAYPLTSACNNTT